MTDLTTNQMRWACAMFERECGKVTMFEGDLLPESCECRGTGRVPLLDGVREDCRACHVQQNIDPNLHIHLNTADCSTCHGLGWTPTEDAWKWLEAAIDWMWSWDTSSYIVLGHNDVSLVADDIGGRRNERISCQGALGDAFFSALYQALLPVAINADEVTTWVKEHVQ